MSAAVARARGLATRIVDRSTLDELARARSLPDLARVLSDRGLAAASSADVASIEQDLRRAAGARLVSLARWCDAAPLRQILFDDEDRRSLRVLVRRIASGSESAGLGGAIPTPSLPEAALSELVTQSTIGGLVGVLRLWEHPYADALAARPRPGAPAIAAAEAELERTWATRARAAARRGDRPVREHVRVGIGLHNLQSLAVSCTQPTSARTADAWLPGGAWLDRDAFAEALVAADPAPWLVIPDGPLAGLDARDARFELRALSARITALGRTLREDPLGSAPILWFALRLRAEAADLRSIVWGVALGRAPGPWVTP